jgi:hypothetical protein
MQRSNRIADTIGALAGVAFVALLFAAVAAVDPQRGVTDEELLTWWSDSGNRDGYVFSMYALLAACPLFLLFALRLRSRLRTGDKAGWADMAFACGIVATAAPGVCAVTRGVIASSMRFEDEPLPGVDTLRFSTSLAFSAWDVVILFVGVMVAIAAVLSLFTHALPRWHSLIGLPVAVGCLALMAARMAPFAIPLVHVWVLATCVQLWRSPAAVPVSGPAGLPAVSSAQA